jgi:hypothetical protein
LSEYRVIWEIDVDGESPKDAALEAYRHMYRKGTSATFFEVIDRTGKRTRVDLLEKGDGNHD